MEFILVFLAGMAAGAAIVYFIQKFVAKKSTDAYSDIYEKMQMQFENLSNKIFKETTQDFSSSAIVYPPQFFILQQPAAPSVPMPVSKTAIVLLPRISAALKNILSTEGRTKFTGASSLSSMIKSFLFPGFITKWKLAGAK